ncbi:DUF7507 domain-containing protein [Nesterenkonia halotolerans]|uniref:Repeat protein (TIGR01451 family) n=1 Tax=Nesterenkonia halotolerans TaxID=225325 RepID=A0ABR9J7D6_9MICC|nr:VWA domain-containing protein [Nesterenkonia halotolerans]MBE1514911.1 putative repeat protein (TIGR01451 family) [Nesterenkonia halotolerans]
MTFVVAATLALGTALLGAAPATAVPSTVPAAPNPEFPQQCEQLNLALSVDLSNSVGDGQLDQLKSQLNNLIDGLAEYPVSIAVHTFASEGPAAGANNATLGLTNTDAGGSQVLKDKINGLSLPGGNAGGTNWDQAFADLRDAPEFYDSVLFLTDGSPTFYGPDRSGLGNSTNQATIDAAVTSANSLKAQGTRIVGVGLIDNLQGAGLDEFYENIPQVTGTQLDQDYYPTDFAALQGTLINLINENCATIDVTKTGSLQDGALGVAGEEITYDFEVTNTGAVTLTVISLTDELPGVSEISYGEWPSEEFVLREGESVSATATYTVTEDDVARGYVDNLGLVTGTPPAGDPVNDEDPDRVELPEYTPAISLTKTGALSEGAAGIAGDQMTYTFEVENTGNVDLTDVTISDDLEGLSEITFGEWPAEAGQLAVGESVTATATYSLTQTDVDNGFVYNNAGTTGNPPNGPPVTDEDENTLPIDGVPSIALTKSGQLPDDADGVPGETVAYDFEITNDGNVTLYDVALSDVLEGLSEISFDEWPAEEFVLAPGESVTASASYELTQADINAGQVNNTATTYGVSQNGGEATDTAEDTVPVDQNPAIILEKQGGLTDESEGLVGDTVGYEFTITNDGNVSLTDLRLTDELLGEDAEFTFGEWPGEPGSLAPGESVTATAPYTLTQADVDAGQVYNEASVAGTPPNGEDVTDTDDHIVPTTGAPNINLTKVALLDDDTEGEVGDEFTYQFTITNNGDVTLNSIALSDDMLDGVSEITYGEWPGEEFVLAPGEQVVATADYEITQADVDNQVIENTATVEGTTPSGENTVTDEDEEDITVPFEPSIGLAKIGALDPEGTNAAGDLVDYTFLITNNGNTTLNSIELSDDMLDGVAEINFDEWPNEAGVLAPGESVSATASYPLTQADVDLGEVTNTADVTGTPPGEEDPVTDEDTATVTVPPTTGISLVKTVSDDVAAAAAGDEVTYTFEVTNTGTVTLNDVVLTDDMEGLSEVTFGEWPTEAGVLAPGETVTATATYTLTQADVNAGEITNDATTTGTPPGDNVNDPEPPVDEDEVTYPVEPDASIAVVKDGQLPEDAAGAPGDVVDYTFEITNDGNVTLTDVTLTDELDGLSEITFEEWPNEKFTLAPGETVSASASYELSQSDIDRGQVDNTATTTGTPPAGDPVDDQDDHTQQVPQEPGITMEKSGALDRDATGVAGDTMNYDFIIANSGNTTLTEVTVIDELDGLSEVSFGEWPNEEFTLAPGETVSASASYELTQADIDAGSIENTATAEGTPPSGEPVTDEGTHEEPLPELGMIELSKTGQLNEGVEGAAGDTVAYSFTATNTGNVTLSGVTIDDELEGLSEVSFGEWPNEENTLAPGESVDATATYQLTQDDVDAAEVENTATVTGTTPSEEPVQDEDDVTVPLIPGAGISLDKTGELDRGAVSAAGDQMLYTFIVTNTGSVSLGEVSITDEMEGLSEVTYGGWPNEEFVLAPGESVTATAVYDLTAADLATGQIDNQASVTGTPPEGEDPVVDEDEHQQPIPGTPGIALVKSGTLQDTDSASEGDEATYQFEVTNTGDTTLREVFITDELEGLSEITYGEWPSEAGVLAPGETVTAEASYALTDGDLGAGFVDNTATATGTPPAGEPVSSGDDHRLELPEAEQSDQGPLATTGTTMAGILALALLVLTVGIVALMRSRRRTVDAGE